MVLRLDLESRPIAIDGSSRSRSRSSASGLHTRSSPLLPSFTLALLRPWRAIGRAWLAAVDEASINRLSAVSHTFPGYHE